MKDLFLFLLFGSCYLASCSSRQNENANNLLYKSSEPPSPTVVENSKISNDNIIIDTIIFSENMVGNGLESKHNESLEFLKFYNSFVKPEMINKKEILDDEYTTKNINYLGQLHDVTNKYSYHVLTDFTTLGKGDDGIPPRGVSKLVFINKKSKEIVIYRVDMPYELPQEIIMNQLKYDYQGQTIKVSLKGQLPPLLCIPGIGCF